MIDRKAMETSKITGNINLKTLAKTNQGSIPLPVTLVPSKKEGHAWDGCPVLHIGNSSGWYLFTLCEHGLLRFKEDMLSIWGDYMCLNAYEILVEAAKAVGWDFSDEVLPPVIEKTFHTEVKREDHPHAKGFKWHMIVTKPDGTVHTDSWRKTQKEAEKEIALFTCGKETRTYWCRNQKHIEHYVSKGVTK
jgi:hypothetical protein